MALVWAYLVGEHKDINIKPIRILKHGRKAKSLVKYGLEEISTILLRPTYTPKFDVSNFCHVLKPGRVNNYHASPKHILRYQLTGRCH